MLKGLELVNYTRSLIRKHLARVERRTYRNAKGRLVVKQNLIPCKNGKAGRPVTSTLRDVANNYLFDLPQDLQMAIAEQPEIICFFTDELVRTRRELTLKELNYLKTSRDAKSMGLLEGEPVQQDLYHRFTVVKKPGERIGYAIKKRYESLLDFAQQEANLNNETLYIVLSRYCLERNARSKGKALEFDCPSSLVGLTSKNIFSIIITNTLKQYKGQLALMKTVEPQMLVDEEIPEEGKEIMVSNFVRGKRKV